MTNIYLSLERHQEGAQHINIHALVSLMLPHHFLTLQTVESKEIRFIGVILLEAKGTAKQPSPSGLIFRHHTYFSHHSAQARMNKVSIGLRSTLHYHANLKLIELICLLTKLKINSLSSREIWVHGTWVFATLFDIFLISLLSTPASETVWLTPHHAWMKIRAKFVVQAVIRKSLSCSGCYSWISNEITSSVILMNISTCFSRK